MKGTLLYCFALLYFPLGAQVQLTDMYPGKRVGSSNPSYFTIFNDVMYFRALHEETGGEIWRSDGTEQGTSLLKDLAPARGGQFEISFHEFNGKLYFFADDRVHGLQVWETEGTAEGTRRVTSNFFRGLEQLVTYDDHMYFFRVSPLNVTEMWRSNGIAGETEKIISFDSWENPSNFMSALGLMFFSVRESTGQTYVWRSDGTEAGTFKVTGPLSGIGADPGGSAHPSQFVEYNGAVYFIASGVFPYPLTTGLVKIDGTVENTEYIKAMVESNSLAFFGSVTVHNDKMYFAFLERDTHRYYIWESDGLAENTDLIYDYTGTSYFSPSRPHGVGDYLFFTSGNANEGTSFIKMNTTTYEPVEIAELSGPMPFKSYFREYDDNVIVPEPGGGFYIKAVGDNSAVFTQLWYSDGTEAGTRKLSRMGSGIDNMILYKDQLHYSGSNESDYELWRSDGTVGGTILTADINASTSGGHPSRPANLHTLANGVVFTGHDAATGEELWVTDGTPEGTQIVDLYPGEEGSFPDVFVVINGKAYFVALVEAGKSQIFESDGTVEGTRAVADAPETHDPIILAALGDDALYVVSTLMSISTLHVLDIATGEFTEVRSFESGGFGFIGLNSVVGDILYFRVSTPTNTSLWTSDGTSGGTIKVTDMEGTEQMLASDNLVYFVDAFLAGSSLVYQLTRTDGTPEGTTSIRDLHVDYSAVGRQMFPFKDKLLFTDFTEEAGREVWVTDGTEANTVMIKDIAPGAADGVSEPSFAQHGDYVYFAAHDPATGTELWRTDGTAAGTFMVKDIVPGPGSSTPRALSSAGKYLYFSAYTPDNGYEIWRTDGTSEGVEQVLDMVPGTGYSNPDSFVEYDGHLIFTARTPSTGRQFWSYVEPVTSIVKQTYKPVSVYPNPSSGIFHIISEEMVGGTIAVYNLQGYCVSLVSGLEVNSEINLQHVPAGLYVMKLRKGNEMMTVKLFKKEN